MARAINSAPCPHCGKPLKFFDWRRIQGRAAKRCPTCDTVLEYEIPPDESELYSDSRVCNHCGKIAFLDPGSGEEEEATP